MLKSKCIKSLKVVFLNLKVFDLKIKIQDLDTIVEFARQIVDDLDSLLSKKP